MENKKRKGFTLIELLAVIVVTSLLLLVAGTVVVNLIKKGKEGATKITWSSIKETAIDYTTEQKNITWLEDTDDLGNPIEYTCTTIQRLINKGYLKNKLVNAEDNQPIETDQFVKITRDEYKVSTSKVKADGESLDECDSKKVPFELNVNGETINYDDKTWYYDKDDTTVSIEINHEEIGNSGIKTDGISLKVYDSNGVAPADGYVFEEDDEIVLYGKMDSSKIDKYGKNVKVCVTILNGNDVSSEECKTINTDFTTPTEPNIEICESKNNNCNAFTVGKWYKGESVIKLSGGGSSPSGIYYLVKDSNNVEQKILKSDPYTEKISSSMVYNIFSKNNVGRESTQKTIDLLIDSNAPVINVDAMDDGWSESKELNATFEDSESGLAAYQVSESDKPSNTWSEISGITNSYNYKSTETKNKTIYIHVKDKVGNISTQKVVITKIDATAPICNVSSTKTDNKWTNQDVTFYYRCLDTESSCEVISSPSYKTFNTTTKKGQLDSYKIKNGAGKTVTCASQEVDVLLDKIKPECTITGTNDSWKNTFTPIEYRCEDADSGCKKLLVGTFSTFTSPTQTKKIPKYIIEDNAGNKNDCGDIDANVYYDNTAPKCVIKQQYDENNWTNQSSRTIIYGCEDEIGGSGCATTDASQKYSTSRTIKTIKTQNLSYTIKDNAGNLVDCNEEVGIYIDTVVPTVTLSRKSGDTGSDGNAVFIATVKDSDSGVKYYKVTTESSYVDDNWKPELNPTVKEKTLEIEVKDNGTYYLWAKDAAGNYQKSSYVKISDIDTGPSKISYTLSPSGWTNGSVTVNMSIEDNDGISGYKLINGTSCGTSGFTSISGSPTTTTKSSSVTQNGKYLICVKDKIGTVVSKEVDVTNIDTTEPIVTLSKSTTSWQKNLTLNFEIKDDVPGIKRYKITTETTKPTSGWTSVSSSKKQVTGTKNVSSNGTYYLWAEDVAGNYDYTTLNVSNIDNSAPNCSIIGASTDWTNDDRTISWGCNDGFGSGCSTSYRSNTYTDTTYTEWLNSYTIYDNMGYSNNCGGHYVDVYIDKEDPSVELYDVDPDSCYYDGDYYLNVKVEFESYDGYSGLYKYCINHDNSDSDSCNKWYSLPNYSGESYDDDFYYEIDDAGDSWYHIDVFVMDYAGNISHDRYKYKDVDYDDCDDEGDYGGGGGSDGDSCDGYPNDIYGYRYSGCDVYYITCCDSSWCQYTEVNGWGYTGEIRRNDLTSSMPSSCSGGSSTDICSVDEYYLFGDYRNHLSGNSSSSPTYNVFSSRFPCWPGGCIPSPNMGYERICVGSYCDDYGYYGWTAAQINEATSWACDFGPYWCSC